MMNYEIDSTLEGRKRKEKRGWITGMRGEKG